MNERINLQDLAALLAEKTAITKKEAELFLREYFDLLSEELINSRLIKIKDLGTFKLLPVDDRESVDITTGERVLIPAHYKVTFVPDKKLAETVNEPFSFFETTEIEVESISEDLSAFSEEDASDDSEQLVEEENEVVTEESSPKENEAVTEALETETLSDEPVTEDEEQQNPAHKPEMRNLCLNCRDYEGHHVFRKKYYIIRKKLRKLKIIIWILSVLLVIAIGYIVNMKLFKNNSITKIIPSIAKEFVSSRKGTPENSTVLTDSIASIEKPVNQDSIKKTASQDSAEKVASPEIADESKQITIDAGQRLASIAQKEYGDKVFWIYIYLENKAIIHNPNLLPIGAKITIPPAGKYGIDCNDSTSIQKAKDMAIRRP